MRISRLLLVFVLATAVAGAVVPNAKALTFLDEICVVESGGFKRICPQGETGKAYRLELKGREGCWPYVAFRALGTLPPGLTLSSSGLVSGTPTQPGSWEAWIEMKDIPASQGGVSWCGDDRATERLFRFTILQGLQIVQRQGTLTLAQSNTPYSLQLSATGATSPTWSVSSGSLPAGITLNSSTGLLAGTPTATGDFTFKITATEGNRSDSQTYTLTVVEQLKISRAAMPAAEVGLPFTADLEATGGRPAHSWAVEGALPAGLTLDAATGLISGKPTAAGSYPLKLTVTDALGLRADVNVTLKVAARLAIVKKVLKSLKTGVSSTTLVGKRGGVGPYRWTKAAGVLPPGIKLNAKTGALTGTPTKAGTYRFRLQVADKLGVVSSAPFVLKVNA
jgi:large repetitive protein